MAFPVAKSIKKITYQNLHSNFPWTHHDLNDVAPNNDQDLKQL